MVKATAKCVLEVVRLWRYIRYRLDVYDAFEDLRAHSRFEIGSLVGITCSLEIERLNMELTRKTFVSCAIQ